MLVDDGTVTVNMLTWGWLAVTVYHASFPECEYSHLEGYRYSPLPRSFVVAFDLHTYIDTRLITCSSTHTYPLYQ